MTTRNQWLSCIYNTIPEQFNPNIRVCGAIYGVALFAGFHKGCFYKVGQFQLCKDSLTCLTTAASKYVSATYDSNGSFELCRVVLVFVISLITNADMVMLHGAMQHDA